MSPRPSLPRGRERILDAAAAVMAERGYAAATIHQIARTAGCADGTVYNHFRDKRDLVHGLLERLVAEQRRPLRLPAAPLDVQALVGAYCRDRARTLSECLLLLRAMLPELLVDAELREQYRARVIRPMLEGGVRLLRDVIGAEIRGDVSIGTLVRLVDAMLLGLAVQWLLGDEGSALDRPAFTRELRRVLESVLLGAAKEAG